MLIVFNRKEKSLVRKCEGCKSFVELRDDEKHYPKTIAIICNAPQPFMAYCFKYDWYRAVSHYHGEARPTGEEPKPTETLKIEDYRIVLNRLRAIGR